MVIFHSNGVYPGMKLWHDEPGRVKSIVMVHPAGHEPVRPMRPTWVVGTIVKINLTSLGRKMYYAIGRPLVKLLKLPLKMDDMQEALVAGQAMFLARIERVSLKQLL